MLSVRESATKQGANIRVRTADGTESAANAFIRTAAGLQRFFSKFAVTASPTGVSGFKNSAGDTPITTNPAAVTVGGAAGALTYLWERTDDGVHPWTIDNPNDSSTTFTTSVSRTTIQEADFKCTVTDAGGHSAEVAVSASAENFYGGLL